MKLFKAKFVALLFVLLTLAAHARAQARVQIDNPGGEARTGWVQGFGVPRTMYPEPTALVGKVQGTQREIAFRFVRSTGTHHIYTAEVEAQAGETVIDVVDLRVDTWHLDGGERWPLDQPFIYHDSVAVNGMGPGFMGEMAMTRGAAGTSVIPMPWSRMKRVVATNQVTVFAGKRAWGRFQAYWWITIHARHPTAELQVVIVTDDLNTVNMPFTRAELRYGAELTSRWDRALATSITWANDRSTVTWLNPGGMLTRCMAPIQFRGTFVFPGATAADRNGPMRATLHPDTMDGHVHPFGPIPRWTGSDTTVSENVTLMGVYEGGGSTNWRSRRRFGARLNPNAPGDDYQFGVVRLPELYAPRGVQLISWMLESAAADYGLRQFHHRDPAKDWNLWQWFAGTETRTWNDRPDSRATPAGVAMLGPSLPSNNALGYTTYDSEHHVSVAPALYGQTGDWMLGLLLNNRFQQSLSYRRRSDPWAGVPRATGRFVLETVQTGAALDEVGKARACVEDILRVALAEWTGGKNDPNAILKPVGAMGRYYPDPQRAIGPWQEGICLAGMFGAWLDYRDVWAGTQFLTDLEHVMREAARTSVRIATVDATRVGWPYKCKYSDTSDPVAAQALIDEEPPSYNELNSRWSWAACVVFLTFGEDGPDKTKAQAIYDVVQNTSTSPRDARWLAIEAR